MDVYQVGQGGVGPGESRKTRQKNDFLEVLREKETKQVARQTPSGSGSRVSRTGNETPKGSTLISLGTVTHRNPNVGSLLIKHPKYRKDCWCIVHSEINRNKPYTRIQAGTEIFIDPKTKELIWGKMRPVSKEPVVPVRHKNLLSGTAQEPSEVKPSLSDRLVGAVEHYLGRPYEEMNCYELLVKGLTSLGVRYRGTGGLGRKLIAMAHEKGLPMNAFFNGEGLVEASGTPVYSKTLARVDSPERQADQLIKEMKPYLENGQILSFSIHTRGHTGIISRENNTWTYINSGDMNNSVKSTGVPKGVGEESLEAEIGYWFRLAQRRGESLRVTLGRLNEQKLVHYKDREPLESEKV